jgi:allantoinase
MITTDHSPCPPEMKRRDEGRFDKAWGGIASLGLALPAVWKVMHSRGVNLESIAKWMASAPARLAGFEGCKGALTQDADADLIVFDDVAEWTISESDLHFRHKLSPYVGLAARGRVRETWLRGEMIFSAGAFFGSPRGREQVRA